MLARNEKGKQARQYFLEVEREWNSPEKVMARPTKKEQRERVLKQVPRRMLYPINEVRILLCCGNEFLQQLFDEGRLPYVLRGKYRYVTQNAIDNYLLNEEVK